MAMKCLRVMQSSRLTLRRMVQVDSVTTFAPKMFQHVEMEKFLIAENFLKVFVKKFSELFFGFLQNFLKLFLSKFFKFCYKFFTHISRFKNGYRNHLHSSPRDFIAGRIFPDICLRRSFLVADQTWTLRSFNYR